MGGSSGGGSPGSGSTSSFSKVGTALAGIVLLGIFVAAVALGPGPVAASPLPMPPGQPTATATPTGPTTTSPPGVTASVTPPREGTVTLEANRSKVVFDDEFVLTGGVGSLNPGCVAGRTVTIRRTVIGEDVQEIVDTLTTNADGTFSQSYAGDRSAQYIASTEPSSVCGSASSAPAPVNVHVRVEIRLSDQTILRGETVRLSGVVAPCDDHAGSKIAFFHAVGGDIGMFDRAILNRRCIARVEVRLHNTSVYMTKYPKQDSDHEKGRSIKKIVTVTRGG